MFNITNHQRTAKQNTHEGGYYLKKTQKVHRGEDVQKLEPL